MHRLIADQAGHRALAAAMTFADHSAVDLERLGAERKSVRQRAQVVRDDDGSQFRHGTVLYPPDFVRTIPAPRSWDERPLVQLLKGDHRDPLAEIERIERWFTELNGSGKRKASLAGNLRDAKSPNFWSALFELMTSRVLLERGWEVSYEPKLNGLTPDFLVRDRARDLEFVAESVSVFQTVRESKAESDIYRAASAIDTISHRRRVFIEDAGLPNQETDLSEIVTAVKRWLDSADGPRARRLRVRLRGSGAFVEVTTDRKLHEVGPAVWGVQSPPFEDITDRRVAASIRAKAMKYAPLATSGTPIVLFLWEGDWLRVGKDPFEWALFGRPQVSLDRKRRLRAEWLRAPGGIFDPRSRRDQVARSISAVAYCSRDWIEGNVYARVRFYHHPNALNALPMELFRGFAQFAVSKTTDEQFTVKWDEEDANALLLV
jgi:hypothetical protein